MKFLVSPWKEFEIISKIYQFHCDLFCMSNCDPYSTFYIYQPLYHRVIYDNTQNQMWYASLLPGPPF